ncbi:MAG TPA: efflux RND transporter periplasmic adaptor subunit [Sedimentisphaerales bacterium]|nr:efflux RND transporter periplasmic adaptor subunit [Sedimentisphaerales bacterium]
MNISKKWLNTLVAGLVVPGGLLWGAFAAGSAAGRPAGITAITIPSADVTLSFVQPGRIAEVRVREGESVKAGQVLVVQDDAVERAKLAQLEAESLDTTQIQAADASLAQKKVDLKKIETAAARNAATELELEYARLNVTIAGLSLQVAIFEHEQAKRKFDEAKLQIDNMSLKSPIGGSVEKIDVETGESINVLESAIRVVQIDPLWIDVPVPMPQAMNLRYGAAAAVEFPEPKKATAEGMVIYIGAVADAASGTLRVRIQVPNKAKRPAGEHVQVLFPTS